MDHSVVKKESIIIIQRLKLKLFIFSKNTEYNITANMAYNRKQNG